MGGPADALVIVNSTAELTDTVRHLWDLEVPFVVLGGGSNILVSDAGVRGVVVFNRAKKVRFDDSGYPPTVRAESGANFGTLARQVAKKGFSGLEWAAGIPGTVGGAIVGNAGAHGGDVAGNLILAEILHAKGPSETWPLKKFAFSYRNSLLKRNLSETVVLGGTLKLEYSTPEIIQAKMQAYLAYRRHTQPPGASMGSMFKNPPGDYAGRLIEAAGLEGARVGDAEINTLHANFFLNRGQAVAADVRSLIRLARQTVAEKFGVELELEIALVGDWE